MKRLPRAASAEETARINEPLRGSGSETDWQPFADSGWWLVHEGDLTEAKSNMLAFERIKRSTRRWASRRGISRNLRREDGGAKVWVRFNIGVQDGQDGQDFRIREEAR